MYKLCCYKPGEVAHIENVLPGEYKEHTTRRLRRSENTLTTSTETETFDEKETKTTDRYEMEREMERTAQQDSSLQAGVNATYNGGVVSVVASTNFATSTAVSTADREAVRQARDVSERSLSRIVKKVKEERVTKLIDEFEENNSHSLDNVGGGEHVVGLYRWVNKIYRARVVNYGKRLMFQFHVPEPANFHLKALTDKANVEMVGIDPPVNPLELDVALPPTDMNDHPGSTRPIHVGKLTSYRQIWEGNSAALCAQYGVEAVPYPQPAIVAQTFTKTVQGSPFGATHEVDIPEGYTALNGWVNFHQDRLEDDFDATITIGNHPPVTIPSGYVPNHLAGNTVFYNSTFICNYENQKKFPVIIAGGTSFYALTVEVYCIPSTKTIEEWQIKIFKSLQEAYKNHTLPDGF